VKWAAANNIVTGYGNGRFGPNDRVTREDLVCIFVSYAEYAKITLSAVREYAAFNDNGSISGYAKDSVERFYRADLIQGEPGNMFNPKGSATRAEVAAIIYRFVHATR
jgi:hypothetical protein